MKLITLNIQFVCMLFGLVGWSQTAKATMSDTLIIGGKKVIVQKVITYDTIPLIEDPKPVLEKPKLKKEHLFFLQAEGGLNRGQLQHEKPDLATLNEFIGNATRNGIYFMLEVGYEKSLNEQLHLKVGAGVQGSKVVNYSFDAALLDDSLFRFESFNINELSQITRYQYDIGTETDTVPLPLNTETIEQFYLSIPFEIVWSPDRDQKRTEWQRRLTAGLGLRVLYALNRPETTLTAISRTNAFFEQAPPDEYDYKQWVLAPKIFVGQRWVSKKGNAAWVTVNANFPFSTIESPNAQFYFNQQWLGLSAGVNIFLP